MRFAKVGFSCPRFACVGEAFRYFHNWKFQRYLIKLKNSISNKSYSPALSKSFALHAKPKQQYTPSADTSEPHCPTENTNTNTCARLGYHPSSAYCISLIHVLVMLVLVSKFLVHHSWNVCLSLSIARAQLVSNMNTYIHIHWRILHIFIRMCVAPVYIFHLRTKAWSELKQTAQSSQPNYCSYSYISCPTFG